MPTVLFVCLPLEGHLRPVTNVAAAVQRLGVDVEFAALEPSRATVESMGVPFVSLGSAERKTSKMGFAERVGDTSTPPVPLDQFVDKAGANFAGEQGWGGAGWRPLAALARRCIQRKALRHPGPPCRLGGGRVPAAPSTHGPCWRALRCHRLRPGNHGGWVGG